MTEQTVWQPVESEPVPVQIMCEDGLILNLAGGRKLDVFDARSRATVILPDDVRLCRRVPAPQGVSVPDKIRRELSWALELAEWYALENSGGEGDQNARLERIRRLRAWLSSQRVFDLVDPEHKPETEAEYVSR